MTLDRWVTWPARMSVFESGWTVTTAAQIHVVLSTRYVLLLFNAIFKSDMSQPRSNNFHIYYFISAFIPKVVNDPALFACRCTLYSYNIAFVLVALVYSKQSCEHLLTAQVSGNPEYFTNSLKLGMLYIFYPFHS